MVFDVIDDIEKDFIPFYISLLSNPPTISPGNFFIIGRHMLSSVSFKNPCHFEMY